jgi:hypothetical protein
MATMLANRLPELVTPLGVLALEGYSSKHDWFSPQELFPVVNALMLVERFVNSYKVMAAYVGLAF